MRWLLRDSVIKISVIVAVLMTIIVSMVLCQDLVQNKMRGSAS